MKRILATTPRYVLTGAVFALLNALLLIGFDMAGLHYVLALLTSALVLVPSSYWVHLRVTYAVEGGADSFMRYCGAQMISMPLSLLLIFVIHDLGGIAMLWTAWIVLALMFLYNLLSSFWAIGSRHQLESSIP